jgi:hypothetical protein
VAALALLTEHGATATPVTRAGPTPLHLAAREPHPVAIRWLLAHGGDRTARDTGGCLALDLALDAPGIAYAPDSTRRLVVALLGGAPRDLLRARRPPVSRGGPHDDASDDPSDHTSGVRCSRSTGTR